MTESKLLRKQGSKKWRKLRSKKQDGKSTSSGISRSTADLQIQTSSEECLLRILDRGQGHQTDLIRIKKEMVQQKEPEADLAAVLLQ